MLFETPKLPFSYNIPPPLQANATLPMPPNLRWVVFSADGWMCVLRASASALCVTMCAWYDMICDVDVNVDVDVFAWLYVYTVSVCLWPMCWYDGEFLFGFCICLFVFVFAFSHGVQIYFGWLSYAFIHSERERERMTKMKLCVLFVSRVPLDSPDSDLTGRVFRACAFVFVQKGIVTRRVHRYNVTNYNQSSPIKETGLKSS